VNSDTTPGIGKRVSICHSLVEGNLPYIVLCSTNYFFMAQNIIIKEDLIEVVVEITKTIFEFESIYYKNHFEDHYKKKEKLILVAYIEEVPVWFIVAYNKYDDKSIYCWMAWVNPKYRRAWVFSKLMQYLTNWAKENNYKSIKLKSRNNRRAMLTYLIKEWYNMLEVYTYHQVKDNRILFEKEI